MNNEKGNGDIIMIKDDCIFCKLSNGVIPTNALYEDEVVKVIFDQNPASKGHVLILPKNHFDNAYSMDEQTAGHVFQIAVKLAGALKKALNCDGLNIVQNNEAAAGQTVFHFHMHLIPRYAGDHAIQDWDHLSLSDEEMKEICDKMKL